MRRMSPELSMVLCIVAVFTDRASSQVARVAREFGG